MKAAQEQPGGLLRCCLDETQESEAKTMTISTLLIIILILILLGAVPAWPHSRGWGYGPSGIVGILLVVLLVLMLMGRV
jgi:hypothetical protein